MGLPGANKKNNSEFKLKNFFILHGLTHKINLIPIGSLKIYQAIQKLFLMC